MSKLLIIPSDLNMVNCLIHKYDGIIIGVDKFSVNLPCSFSLNEISKITEVLKKENKEIFVAVNKNIHNEELSDLEEILTFLNSLPIDGILYYDIAIVNLKDKLKLNIPLVWNQEHMTTNYLTCNFWNKAGISSVYLSGDITMDEALEINENCEMKTFINVFGYLPMFASYRHLVSNYINTFSLKNSQNEIYKMEKEGKVYTIVDNELGSFVYSNNILNGLEEYLVFKQNNVDYAVLNSFEIGNDNFTKIVDMFTSVNDNNVKEYNDTINNMFQNTDKGFLYKETVYKVKNNE